jgi:hypothetical protein
MDYCRSASAKYRLLMAVGGGDIGSERMLDQEDDRHIERMWKAGKSMPDIAAEMGIHRTTPRYRLLRMGYTTEELKRR